jgi:hypothetical protein
MASLSRSLTHGTADFNLKVLQTNVLKFLADVEGSLEPHPEGSHALAIHTKAFKSKVGTFDREPTGSVFSMRFYVRRPCAEAEQTFIKQEVAEYVNASIGELGRTEPTDVTMDFSDARIRKGKRGALEDVKEEADGDDEIDLEGIFELARVANHKMALAMRALSGEPIALPARKAQLEFYDAFAALFGAIAEEVVDEEMSE